LLPVPLPIGWLKSLFPRTFAKTEGTGETEKKMRKIEGLEEGFGFFPLFDFLKIARS